MTNVLNYRQITLNFCLTDQFSMFYNQTDLHGQQKLGKNYVLYTAKQCFNNNRDHISVLSTDQQASVVKTNMDIGDAC